MKLDLLTNVTVVDDAIRFVSEKQLKDKPNLSSGQQDKGSKKPNYNESIELKGKQEKQTIEITTNTINQVF